MSAKFEHLRDHLQLFHPTLSYADRVLPSTGIASCVFSAVSLQQCLHWAEHGLTQWVKGEQRAITNLAQIAAIYTDTVYSFLGEQPLVLYCAATHPLDAAAQEYVCEIVQQDDVTKALAAAGAARERTSLGACWSLGPSFYGTLGSNPEWQLLRFTMQHVDPALLSLALETGYPLPPRFCATDLRPHGSILVTASGDAATDARLLESQVAAMYQLMTRMIYTGTTSQVAPGDVIDTHYIPCGTFGHARSTTERAAAPRSITDDLSRDIMAGTEPPQSHLLSTETLARLEHLCLVFVGVPANHGDGTWERAVWVLAFKDRVKISIEHPGAPSNLFHAHGRIIIDDPYLMSAILYASQHSGAGREHYISLDIGVRVDELASLLPDPTKVQEFIEHADNSGAQSTLYEWLWQWIIANPITAFGAIGQTISFQQFITH